MDHRIKYKKHNYMAFRKKIQEKKEPRARQISFNLTPRIQSIQGKADKFNFIKIKIFTLWKNLEKEWKDKVQPGRKSGQTTYQKKKKKQLLYKI